MSMFGSLMCFFFIGFLPNVVNGAPQFPAMFVFGDSLIDSGNNNYLTSFAKANYLPYGVDFNFGPTGRFSNGKTIIDFLGDFFGLPLLPTFVNTLSGQANILNGVNYASAAGGILDETGRNLGQRFSFNQQVQNFRVTLGQLARVMDANTLRSYLASSLVVVALGHNDYINNYLQPTFYRSSSTYTPTAYADLLMTSYSRQIMTLYALGMRKFGVAGIGTLGCIPYQLARGAAPRGQCVGAVNEMANIFNQRLTSFVDQLNKQHPDAKFVYANVYGVCADVLTRPSAYGFTVIDTACCGIGRNRGQITCLPLQLPCLNRDQHVFWDAFHPSQAFNFIIAQRVYNGSQLFSYPINLSQLAQA